MSDPLSEAGTTLDDNQWMAQALGLAQAAVGLASPNPTVGCVLVREGVPVGAGAHEYDKRHHAEIIALRAAGELARGATAYVTLEPCSHDGRTGPCADALIAAGVARVVVATADVNPVVQNQGIARLRNAGIAVSVGLLGDAARRLNDAFAKYIRTRLPYVTLKAAMTLDGRIAPAPALQRPGEIAWITGPESREQVHHLRSSVDAVITGSGTVLADDPLLTDRSGLRRRRPLLRVLLDSQLQLPLSSKLVESSDLDVIVFATNPPQQRVQALSSLGISVREMPTEPGDDMPSLVEVLKVLGEMQITSVMVEGGSRLNASFLQAGLVDRLYLFYAAQFLGPQAQPLLASPPGKQPTVREMVLHRFGADFAVEARLNDPWLP